jgi:capsular polysaccharide biosynthesis protein
MELKIIGRVLLRYWWLILVPTLVAAVFVLPELLNRSAVSGGYNTILRYSAAQEPAAQPPRDGDYQDIWLASELTVNALTAWVQTDSFRHEIAQLLARDLDLAPLSIAADNERSIGQLFLSHPDEAALQEIAAAAIEVLKTRNQVYFPQVGSAPAAVTLLDDPVINPVPPPLTNRFAPLIRIALGLIVGVALAFLAHYLDPSLRRREELEALGIPVIGSLPRK